MSQKFYEKLGRKDSIFCGCPKHLHSRHWIHPPCKTSFNSQPKASSICTTSKLNMTDSRMSFTEKKRFDKIRKEIECLKNAHAKLETGEPLSEHTKELIEKWQSNNKQSGSEIYEGKISTNKKEIVEMDTNTKQNLALLSRIVNDYQEAVAEERSDGAYQKSTQIKSLIKENRRLMKKVKKLEAEQDKDEEEQRQTMRDYRDKSIKSKYSNLLLYVVKLEAENQKLKQELTNSLQSESADEKVVAPFKQRINLLEDQLQKQNDKMIELKAELSNPKTSEGINASKSYETQLLEKLGNTREVYEKAIHGYKEELQKLLQKCTYLQEENKSLRDSSTIKQFQAKVDKLELICSEKNSMIERLEHQLKSLEQNQQENLLEKIQESLNESLIPLDADGILKKIEEALLKNSDASFTQIYEQKLAAKEEEIAVLNKLFDEYKNRIEDLSTRLAQAESMSNSSYELDWKKELEQEKKQVESLSEHVVTLKDQNKNLCEQINHLRDQLKSSSKLLESKDSILDRVSLQLENKIQECSNLTIQVSKLAERTEEIPRLNIDLENGYKLQISDLQAQNSRLASEVSRINSEKDSSEKKLKSEARSLEEQVDKLTLKNNACQRQLDTIISAYRATFSSNDGNSPRAQFNSHLSSNFHGKS